ncbi:hypothetical protein EV127DRAFT_482705 [Xylaria flabelliformis]|nr:hypothetical protein EV127DRAFT_482705 [Xylaria flabelliformis]
MAAKKPEETSAQRVNIIVTSWRLEVACCLATFISLLATIVTLLPHANSPLPQWPFSLSINTLLAIYTVVFKSTLISVISACIAQLQWAWFATPRPLSDLLGYNSASRDAWGSLQWLVKYRQREPLTIFAAFLMISSLAVDPFVQQLIMPKDCETALRGLNATILRTNMVNSDESEDGESFFARWVLEALKPSLTDTSLVDSSLFCPTGNCTFPTQYSSLAYCSSCTDISNDVVVHVAGSSRTVENYTTTLFVSNNLDGFNYTSEFKTMSYLNGTDGILSTNMTFLDAFTSDILIPVDPGKGLARTAIGTEANVEIIVLMSTNYYSSRGWDPITSDKMTSDWRCRGSGAARCSLYTCARVYQASVEAGRLSESIVAQSDGIYWANSLLDMNCLSSTQRAQVKLEGYSLNTSSSNVSAGRFFSYGTTNGTLASDLLADGCLFHSDALQLRTALLSLLGQGVAGNYIWGSSSDSSVFLHAGSFSGSPQLLSMFNNGNISFERVSGTFTSLSDSLTDYMRTHGNSNYSTPAQGTILHYATCLEVRWPWIAFPVSLYIGTSILLCTVAMTAAKNQTPLWKASPLAWIYRGPAQDFDPDSIPDLTVKEMRRRAKSTAVVLSGGDDLRIRVVDSAT